MKSRLTRRNKLSRPARPFWPQALLAAVALAVVSYSPVFLGKVPLPADLLRYFPVWEEMPVSDLSLEHGELGDLLTLMYPWRLLLHESFRSGSLPFWNPHSFGGAPFLASPISAVFYPLNWLFAFLPIKLAWSIQFPVRMALATFFAELLGRRLGASRIGALLTGCVFSMSGFMIGWQGWPQAEVMLWVPLGMLAVLRLRRRPRARGAAFFALAITMPLLAGHPEVCLYAVGAVAAFALFQLCIALRRGRRAGWVLRYVGALLMGAAMAGGLSAVQLVPTAEWLPQINRGLAAPWKPRPSRDVVSIVSRDTESSPNSSRLEVPEESCYAGIGTLLLAPLALLSRRKAAALFFALLAFLSFQVAFGLVPFSQIFRAVPILRAMPGRILGLTDLSLAILAGLGLTYLREAGMRRGSPRLPDLVLPAMSAVGVAWGILVLRGRVSSSGIAETLRRPIFAATLLIASGVLVLAALRSRRSNRILVACVAGLVAFDVATFSWRHVPLVPPDRVFPPAPTIDYLRAHLRNGERVLFLDSTAPRNAEIPYGLETLDGYPQVLRRTARLVSPLNGGTEQDGLLRPFTVDSILAADRSILDSLGVRFLVTNLYRQPEDKLARFGRLFPLRFARGNVRVFENVQARARVIATGRASAEGARQLEHGETVRIDALSDPPCVVVGFSTGRNSVSGSVVCRTSGVLVVSQTFYPGWRATVAGKAVPVLRTEEQLCAIPVPPGRHPFSIQFLPTWWVETAGLSAASAIAIALALVWPQKKRMHST